MTTTESDPPAIIRTERFSRRPRAELRRRAEELFEMVGLSGETLRKPATALSGGPTRGDRVRAPPPPPPQSSPPPS